MDLKNYVMVLHAYFIIWPIETQHILQLNFSCLWKQIIIYLCSGSRDTFMVLCKLVLGGELYQCFRLYLPGSSGPVWPSTANTSSAPNPPLPARVGCYSMNKNGVYLGLFCHDQVSSCKFLEFFNFWRNLQMFLDTMEPRTENKKSSLEKTVLVMWAQICGIIS